MYLAEKIKVNAGWPVLSHEVNERNYVLIILVPCVSWQGWVGRSNKKIVIILKKANILLFKFALDTIRHFDFFACHGVYLSELWEQTLLSLGALIQFEPAKYTLACFKNDATFYAK